MIDAIIRGGLGELWSTLLDFYIENAYWINSIVVIYAILLITSRQGYRKILSAIKLALIDKYGEDIENKNENWYKRILEKKELDWGEIASHTWIPIISAKGWVGFRIKNPESLEKEFTPEIIYKALKSGL